MVNHHMSTLRLYAPDGGGGSGGSSDSGAGGSAGGATGDGGDGASGGAGSSGAGSNANDGGAGNGENNNDDGLDLGDAGKKALETERRARRDAERQARASAKELEQLRSQTMSEQEKAVQKARDEGRSEAMRETGTKLVDAEVRSLASGRNVDADALLEGIDRSKFLDDNGDPDRKAIKAWVDKIAPAGNGGNGFPDLGQGAGRGNAGSGTDMNALIRERMRAR